MKVLTLWPEWAWAICHLGKRIENRTWEPPTSIIGRSLAIHAGASIGGRPGSVAMHSGIMALRKMAYRAGWNSSVHGGRIVFFNVERESHDFIPSVIPKKAIVASCIVGLGCYATPGELKWAAEGQKHWRLLNVGFPSSPVSIKGAQGLWDWGSQLPRLNRSMVGKG